MNELPQTSIETGIVKWFSRLKGYGFILPDSGGQDVFAHYSAIAGEGYRNLRQGERVEYNLIDKGKGPQAANICALKQTAAEAAHEGTDLVDEPSSEVVSPTTPLQTKPIATPAQVVSKQIAQPVAV